MPSEISELSSAVKLRYINFLVIHQGECCKHDY